MAQRSKVTDAEIRACFEDLKAQGKATTISAVCEILHVGRSRVNTVQAQWLKDCQLEEAAPLEVIPESVQKAINCFLADAQRKYRDQASALNDEIKAALSEAVSQKQIAEQERDRLMEEVAVLKADAERYQKERDKAVAGMEAARKERDGLEGKLDQLQTQYDALNQLHQDALKREQKRR